MATDLCSICLLQPSTSACISNARRLNTVNLRNEFTPKKQKIGGRTWKITQQAHTNPGTEGELPAGPLEFNEQRYLDGRASDPRVLGWIRGAPPAADKCITFESDTFLEFPKIRWSLSHMRELVGPPPFGAGRGDFASGAPWPDKRNRRSDISRSRTPI